MSNPQALKGHSRMIILAALNYRSMHGYALSEYLKNQMAEAFKFGVGMLYPLLHQMEKERLIVGTWAKVPGADRRIYRLTKRGRRELNKQRDEWQTLNHLVGKLVYRTAV